MGFISLASGQNDLSSKYAKTIKAQDLGAHLFEYASDEFQGGNTGDPGQKKAVGCLKNFYITSGTASPFGGDNYFQEVPADYLKRYSIGHIFKASENVLAFIKGSEKP